MTVEILKPSQARDIISSLFTTGGVTISILGSSRSGKTTFLLHELLPLFKDFINIMFAPSFSGKSYDWIRDSPEVPIIVPSYDEEVVSSAVVLNSYREDKLPFCFIFDDVVTLRSSNKLSEMFLTLRNLNISTIVVTQYYAMLKPEMRQNVNFSFYFKINSVEGRKKVATDILPDLFADQDKPGEAYGQITEDYIIMSDNLNGLYYLIPR